MSSRLSRSERRKRIEALIRASDFEAALAGWNNLPLHETANALFRFLPDEDLDIRDRAARAMGLIVARLYDEEPEKARQIATRLNWMLNEESGGCPWGALDALAEIAVAHPKMREEFAAQLVSNIDPEGNYLRHEPLMADACRAIGRVAETDAELMSHARPHLESLSNSSHPALRREAQDALDVFPSH